MELELLSELVLLLETLLRLLAVLVLLLELLFEVLLDDDDESSVSLRPRT